MKIDKELWSKTDHYCKTCGKLITDFFGSGIYCCRACANSRGKRTEQEKQKIKVGMQKSAK